MTKIALMLWAMDFMYVDEIIFAIQTMALDEKSAIIINPLNPMIKER